MRTLAQKPGATRQTTSAKSSIPVRQHFGQNRGVNSIPHLQRTIGIQAVQRILQTPTEKLNAGLTSTAAPRLGHDFSRIPIHPLAAGALQTKFTINKPGDQYEQEADRVSEQVMRMEAPDIAHTAPPATQRLGTGFQQELGAKHLQRLCTECEEEALHRKAAPTGAGAGWGQAPRQAEAKVDAVSGGQPLSNEQRAFFEPRFGVDFSRVRIHADGPADTAARAVGALAFTRVSDIVFRGDQYRPHTFAGRQLLAHELTHVVQQGAAPGIQHRSANESGEAHIQSSEVRMGVAGHVLQCLPGDGMKPPGDCGWPEYLVLRGSVATADAGVRTLGRCYASDSCILLATKMAAISAEIAARVAVAVKCFRGGDQGHIEQLKNKLNMMNRCSQFFSKSNCPPKLIAAMAVVIELAREAIAAAAVVLAVALVVALIAAIIALAEVIVELVAAAAAGAVEAAAAAAAAAVIALLVLLKNKLSPKEEAPPPGRPHTYSGMGRI